MAAPEIPDISHRAECSYINASVDIYNPRLTARLRIFFIDRSGNIRRNGNIYIYTSLDILRLNVEHI